MTAIAQAQALASGLHAGVRHLGRRHDDAIVGMALDVGNSDRIRLERDRADYFSMTVRGIPL
jgi:hypothetical protein